MKHIVRAAAVALSLALGFAALVAAAPSVTVLADRILTGHGNQEFIPRFATYLPGSLTVPTGTTVTLSGAVTYAAIEVAGTLRCSGAVTLRVTHLVVLPGGTFDCQQPLTITFRDVPIDTTRDPYQLGNGLINMGRVILRGQFKPAYAILSADVASGATTVQFPVPTEWQVGDEVLLPDTRPVVENFWAGERTYFRRESRVFIIAKTATSITLSKPLDFAHLAVLNPDGSVAVWPRIANLSRSSSLLSENPRGARGHVIMLGHTVSWDIQGVGFYDLGRTTGATLDSATADTAGAITKIGTNQVGRYAFHSHHTHGAGSVFRGNALVDQGLTKAGVAVHATEGVVMEDVVIVGFTGAGLVNEDGPERNNTYRRIFAAYHKGVFDVTANGAPGGAKGLLLANRPFAEGAGVWSRGVANTYEDIEVWNNNIGFLLMYNAQVKSPDFDVTQAVPVKLSGLVAGGNYFSGMETWGAPARQLGDGITLIGNGFNGVHTGSAEFGNFLVKNLTVLCPAGKSTGVEVSSAYIFVVVIDGGSIRGCAQGTQDAVEQTLRNLTLQNVLNINHSFANRTFLLHDNVQHVPYGAHPPKYITFMPPDGWQHGQPAPELGARVADWAPAFGSRYTVINWQGTGENLFLYRTSQRRSLPAYPAKAGFNPLFSPEAGLTLGQTWDRWGIATGGGVVGDDAVTIPGIINGLAKRGTDYPLGPPRGVLNTPNLIEPAVVSDGFINFYGTPSGNPVGTSGHVWFQVDNGPVQRSQPLRPAVFDVWFARVSAAGLADGTHTVTTWRESTAGQVMPETAMTFTFFLGTNTPPPPPPPPAEVCGDGIDNDGDGLVDEGCVPPPPPPDPCVADPVRLTVQWPADAFVTSITVTDTRGCVQTFSR